jgi:hypothetical protein
VPAAAPVGTAPAPIPGHLQALYPSLSPDSARPTSQRRPWPAAPPRVGRSALFLAAMSVVIVLATITLRVVHAAP